MRLDLHELFENVDIPEKLEKVDRNIKIDEIALINKISSKTDIEIDKYQTSKKSRLKKVQEMLKNNMAATAAATLVVVSLAGIAGHSIYKNGTDNIDNKELASKTKLEKKEAEDKNKENKLSSENKENDQIDKNSEEDKKAEEDKKPDNEVKPTDSKPSSNDKPSNNVKPSENKSPINNNNNQKPQNDQGTSYRADSNIPKEELSKPSQTITSPESVTPAPTPEVSGKTEGSDGSDKTSSSLGETGSDLNPSIGTSNSEKNPFSEGLKLLTSNGWNRGEVVDNEWITLPSSFEYSMDSEKESLKYVFLNILSKDFGYDYSSFAGQKIKETRIALYSGEEIKENRTANILSLNGKVIGMYIYDEENILESESINHRNISHILGNDAQWWIDFYQMN